MEKSVPFPCMDDLAGGPLAGDVPSQPPWMTREVTASLPPLKFPSASPPPRWEEPGRSEHLCLQDVVSSATCGGAEGRAWTPRYNREEMEAWGLLYSGGK